MIATTHMLVGAAAGVKARSVSGAVAIGALTHLLVDAIPHRDYHRDTLGGLVLSADLTAGVLGVRNLSGNSTVALAGALGGALPDALRAAEQAVAINVTSWAHDASHSDTRPRPLKAGVAQALIAMAAAMMLSRTLSAAPVRGRSEQCMPDGRRR